MKTKPDPTIDKSDALQATTPEEADKIVAKICLQLKEQGSAMPEKKLEEFVRSEICQWVAVWSHKDHGRMLKLYRPSWPPQPDGGAK